MNFNKTIIIYPSLSDKIKGLVVIEKEFITAGYSHLSLFLDDSDFLTKLMEECINYKCLIVTHNFRGWELIKEINVNYVFYSTLDTPYNKFKILNSLNEKCLISLADKTHYDLCVKINPHARFFYSPAFVVNPIDFRSEKKISDRKYDLLFVGRMGVDKIDFQHKSRLEKLMAPSIIKQILKKGDKQIFETAIRFFKPFIFFRLSKIKWNSDEFMDYCWKLGHAVRSKRRIRVISELTNLNENYSICYITDKTELINKNKLNQTILPFQPWDKVLEIMSDSKIVINIQPYHLYGYHERMLTAMSLGAVCLTDDNLNISKDFINGEELVVFNYNEMNLIESIEGLLCDLKNMERIATNGKTKVLKEHMPNKHIERIITEAKLLNNK